jgi:poly(beta-D-mannuronate) lyase
MKKYIIFLWMSLSSACFGMDASDAEVDVSLGNSQGRNIYVSSTSAFLTALKAINAGDTITFRDGQYELSSATINVSGQPTAPVCLQSEHQFGAKIIGNSSLYLNKISYFTLTGFDFDVAPVSTIIKLVGCSHVRITRNKFMMKTTTSAQSSKWIFIGDVWDNGVCVSSYNRIDHNLFDGKHDLGALLVVDGTHGTPDISKYDRIDHNIFRNNTPRIENEKETIRIGVSELSMQSAYCTVDYNLFEDCDGDPEIISVKSCNNQLMYNTFRHSLGTLSLRHGNNNRAEGNLFFGDGKTGIFSGSKIGCGGIRVYGKNHVIVNNYMVGLTGSKWDAAFVLTNGDVQNNSTSYSKHFVPENITFSNNTLINNVSNIEVGYNNGGSFKISPVNCTISNNIVSSPDAAVVKPYSSSSLDKLTFSNNIFYVGKSGSIGFSNSPAQAVMTDPLLVLSDKRCEQTPDVITDSCMYKLSVLSPAIDASKESPATMDFEGQKAVGIRDIGADEYNASDSIRSQIITPSIAGPLAPENVIFERTVSSFPSLSVHPRSSFLISSGPGIVARIESDKDQPGYINMYDSKGMKLTSEVLDLRKGLNTYSVTVPHHVNGTLIISLRISDNHYAQKIPCVH